MVGTAPCSMFYGRMRVANGSDDTTLVIASAVMIGRACVFLTMRRFGPQDGLGRAACA